MIDKLEQFGKVEICKEENQTFHIKITEGFKSDMSNTLKVLNLISDHLAGTYTKVIKCVVREIDFEYIAKK